jgi:hypothetical protein
MLIERWVVSLDRLGVNGAQIHLLKAGSLKMLLTGPSSSYAIHLEEL